MAYAGLWMLTRFPRRLRFCCSICHLEDDQGSSSFWPAIAGDLLLLYKVASDMTGQSLLSEIIIVHCGWLLSFRGKCDCSIDIKNRFLKQYHFEHQGINQIKVLAHIYVYLPNVIKQLEDLIHGSTKCQLAAKSSRKRNSFLDLTQISTDHIFIFCRTYRWKIFSVICGYQ